MAKKLYLMYCLRLRLQLTFNCLATVKGKTGYGEADKTKNRATEAAAAKAAWIRDWGALLRPARNVR